MDGISFTALMIEAVRTSETLFYFNETTWWYTPERRHLHAVTVPFLHQNALISGFF
jgi:hypothetical protein